MVSHLQVILSDVSRSLLGDLDLSDSLRNVFWKLPCLSLLVTLFFFGWFILLVLLGQLLSQVDRSEMPAGKVSLLGKGFFPPAALDFAEGCAV